MIVVYEGDPIEPHKHETVPDEIPRRSGAIVQCSCGEHWEWRYVNDDSWSDGWRWAPVRWWNFAARRRIAAYERNKIANIIENEEHPAP